MPCWHVRMQQGCSSWPYRCSPQHTPCHSCPAWPAQDTSASSDVCWHVLLCPRFDAASGDVRYFVDPETQLRLPYCPQVRLAWSSGHAAAQQSSKAGAHGCHGQSKGHAASSRCEKELRADPGLVILKLMLHKYSAWLNQNRCNLPSTSLQSC